MNAVTRQKAQALHAVIPAQPSQTGQGIGRLTLIAEQRRSASQGAGLQGARP